MFRCLIWLLLSSKLIQSTIATSLAEVELMVYLVFSVMSIVVGLRLHYCLPLALFSGVLLQISGCCYSHYLFQKLSECRAKQYLVLSDCIVWQPSCVFKGCFTVYKYGRPIAKFLTLSMFWIHLCWRVCDNSYRLPFIWFAGSRC